MTRKEELFDEDDWVDEAGGAVGDDAGGTTPPAAVLAAGDTAFELGDTGGLDTVTFSSSSALVTSNIPVCEYFDPAIVAIIIFIYH